MANDLTITTLESPETLKDIPICEKLVERAELSGEVLQQIGMLHFLDSIQLVFRKPG